MRGVRRQTIGLGAVIVVAVLVAYIPSMQGGFVWDDDSYVTDNLTLRSLDGLRRIWFEPGAVPQYYPLTFTSFWVDYHLWGLAPLGYHVVNVLLHALNGVLVWLVLRRLSLPGAWFAAALFALHPVHVESVAWITERKNVLSGVGYLAAVLAYLRFAPPNGDATPVAARWRWYAAALLLFLGALFGKTVTCSLPAALLLLTWWRRGTLRWRDVWPLLPFFAVAAGLSAVTMGMETHNVGAEGLDWQRSFVERCLIAGRAFWFYAATFAFPHRLTFIYPRWRVDVREWWQFMFPAAALVLVAALFLARRRIGRGPLVSVLFFAGTLAPALGFFDVYLMQYSFVADHFVYLASLGLCALVAAVAATIPRRVQPIGCAVLLALCALTWKQGYIYRDIEALWRDTIAKNPDCWLAYNNLGVLHKDRPDEAIAYFTQALRANPDYVRARFNLGTLLATQGRMEEATAQWTEALRVKRAQGEAYNSTGVALAEQGRLPEAVEQFTKALQTIPQYAEAQNNLGNVLMAMGRLAEADAHYREALQITPSFAEAHNNLGNVLATQGRLNDAIAQYAEAVRIRPNYDAAKNNLSRALAAQMSGH